MSSGQKLTGDAPPRRRRHRGSISVTRLSELPAPASATANAAAGDGGGGDGDDGVTGLIVAREVAAAPNSLTKVAVLDGVLPFLPFPEFGAAARVCKVWHSVTLGSNIGAVDEDVAIGRAAATAAIGTWRRGVRQGEINPGKHFPFWVSVCAMRNCIDDATAGSLVRCMRDHSQAMQSVSAAMNAAATTAKSGSFASQPTGYAPDSLFDADSGGELAFRRRVGVFSRLQSWASTIPSAEGPSASWKARAAASIDRALVRFLRRQKSLREHTVPASSSSSSSSAAMSQALRDRVTRIARAYVGFVVARHASSPASSPSSDGSSVAGAGATVTHRMPDSVRDGSPAAQVAWGLAHAAADDENSAWLRSLVAQTAGTAVPLLAVMLWESRATSLSLLADEDEDAFWTLAVLNEHPWYGLGCAASHAADLNSLLRLHAPLVANHLASEEVTAEDFAPAWYGSLFAHAQALADQASVASSASVLYRVWDLFVTEGWKSLHRAAVALCKLHEPAILSTKGKDKLLALLIGVQENTGSDRVTMVALPAASVDAGPAPVAAFVDSMLALKITRKTLQRLVLKRASGLSLTQILPKDPKGNDGEAATAPPPPLPGTATRDETARWRATLTEGNPDAGTVPRSHSK